MEQIKLNACDAVFTGEVRFIEPPQVVGYLVIANGSHVGVYEKPQEDHLANMKATFGWEWKDA